ncbi:putative N-acetylmannosaminyltransferase [compost metagenome]
MGATFDFLSGSVKRAPSFMQKTGFEWFWRLSQEPGRLWKRYLVDDAQFLLLLLKELRKRDKVKEGGLE